MIRVILAVAVIAGAPGLAFAAGAYMPKPPHPVEPCGWRGGGLPDPAITNNCLAHEYVKPKPNKPDIHTGSHDPDTGR